MTYMTAIMFVVVYMGGIFYWSHRSVKKEEMIFDKYKVPEWDRGSFSRYPTTKGWKAIRESEEKGDTYRSLKREKREGKW